MKLTKQRLIEIIKEEYQSVLSEKTVRMGNYDINFHGGGVFQIVGDTGKLGLSKMDAKMIINAVRQHLSITPR